VYRWILFLEFHRIRIMYGKASIDTRSFTFELFLLLNYFADVGCWYTFFQNFDLNETFGAVAISDKLEGVIELSGRMNGPASVHEFALRVSVVIMIIVTIFPCQEIPRMAKELVDYELPRSISHLSNISSIWLFFWFRFATIRIRIHSWDLRTFVLPLRMGHPLNLLLYHRKDHSDKRRILTLWSSSRHRNPVSLKDI
jgi:hypothetical protein